MVPPPGHGGFNFAFPCFQSCAIVFDRIISLIPIMAFDCKDSGSYLASQLAKVFSRSLQQHAAHLGFLPGQFPVLLELWTNEGLTQKQLIDRLDVEQATVANTLVRMERDGLIERRAHPTDRRARLIYLTERAKTMRDDALQAAREADRALFNGFRNFERELALEYMRRLIENAHKLENL